MPLRGDHSASVTTAMPRPSIRREDALAPVVLAAASDPSDLRSWRRSGTIERVRRGAYVPAAPSRGPALDRQSRALARIEAVAAQLRTEFWFSHESAALIWGCEVVGLSGGTHVTQAWCGSTRGDPRLVRHTLELPPSERAERKGLPVTTLERTAVDCATSMRGRNALVVIDSALRAGADRVIIESLLRARKGRRGVRRARTVIERANGASEPPGETMARWEIVEAGLPQPEAQLAVVTASGRFRLDLAWRDARVAVEFDGFVKYSGAFGAPADVVFAEKRRQEALEQVGWLIIRITWEDLDHPERWLARLHTALAHRTRGHR